MDERRFRIVLALLALAGFGARIAYGLIADVPKGFGDDVWYSQVANGIVHGRGFSDPFQSIEAGKLVFGTAGEPIPTAFHPPLFPAVLAIGSAVGLDSYTAHQVVACALGAATIPVVGVLGRRVAGERAGIAAATLAAVFIPMISRDALLAAESLYGLLIALSLLAALRLRERPTTARALALGAALGFAALTRTEAVLLLPLLLATMAYLGEAGRRPRTAALVCAAFAVVCAPWCVRNSLTFDRPTAIYTGVGSVFAGANLDSTYHGRRLGGWDFDGLYRTPTGRRYDRNEAARSEHWRKEGIDYARDHAGRLPVVVAVRVLRTWDLYPFSPVARARFGSGEYKHVRALEYPSQLIFLATVLLAVAGAVRLRRRREVLWPLLVPLVLVTLVSATGYGDPRFREAADVSLLVLAGAGASLALAHGAAWRQRSRTAST
jgi:4-amino-4-deoxy-L-arabinose transferase-like glycosyltransferase